MRPCIVALLLHKAWPAVPVRAAVASEQQCVRSLGAVGDAEFQDLLPDHWSGLCLNKTPQVIPVTLRSPQSHQPT